MTTDDRASKEAEELLPWITDELLHNLREVTPKGAEDIRKISFVLTVTQIFDVRPAVAAKLRKIRQEEQALANEKCRCFLERAKKAESEIALLRAELAKVKA